jgi:hypothetical protein
MTAIQKLRCGLTASADEAGMTGPAYAPAGAGRIETHATLDSPAHLEAFVLDTNV